MPPSWSHTHKSATGQCVKNTCKDSQVIRGSQLPHAWVKVSISARCIAFMTLARIRKPSMGAHSIDLLLPPTKTVQRILKPQFESMPPGWSHTCKSATGHCVYNTCNYSQDIRGSQLPNAWVEVSISARCIASITRVRIRKRSMGAHSIDLLLPPTRKRCKEVVTLNWNRCTLVGVTQICNWIFRNRWNLHVGNKVPTRMSRS